MPRFKHEAWNVLFDNFPVPKILERFLCFYELFGMDFKKSESQARRDNAWIATRESMIRRKKAWNILFFRMNIYEIIEEINKVWLDPDYKLVIMVEKCKRVIIGIK